MRKQLLFFVVFLLPIISYSGNGIAGDISYTHMSGYNYSISVRLFTKTSLTTLDYCSICVYFGDGDSAVFPRVNGPIGSCSNGEKDGVVLPDDIKFSLYSGVHTFPGSGSYVLSTGCSPNHITQICNFNSPNTTTLLFNCELIINNILGQSNSPYSTSIPITKDTLGLISYYNPNIIKPTGDSLFIELIPPIGATMFTFPPSSSSFSINDSFGLVTWNAPNSICFYNYSFTTKQYRNFAGAYFYVGTTMQEVSSEVFQSLSIHENENDIIVNVYPNPSSNTVNFDFSNINSNGNFNLKIINGVGQIVKSIDIKNGFEKTITIENLQSGVYFYCLNDSKNKQTLGKFVILNENSK